MDLFITFLRFLSKSKNNFMIETKFIGRPMMEGNSTF